MRPAAALVAVIIVLLTACGADDDAEPTTPSPSSPPGGSQSTTVTTAGGTTTTAPATTVAPAPEVRSITVAFAGGAVAGGPAEVTVSSGERVHLEVTSDVEEEVHVHGFDLKQPVGPGVAAVFDFVADLPGIWEVELEGSGVPLLRLEVQG